MAEVVEVAADLWCIYATGHHVQRDQRTTSNITIPEGFLVQSVSVLPPVDGSQLARLLLGGNNGNSYYANRPILGHYALDFSGAPPANAHRPICATFTQPCIRRTRRGTITRAPKTLHRLQQAGENCEKRTAR